MEFLIVIIILAIIGLFISATFLLWSARIAKIKNRTFGKALIVTILSGIVGSILSQILSIVPIIGTMFGLIGGVFIAAYIMMKIFDTTFRKALGATVFAGILSLVFFGIALLVFIMFFPVKIPFL